MSEKDEVKNKIEDAYKQIASEEMKQGTSQLADLLADYYRSLIGQSVNPEHAILIVLDFQKILFMQGKQ